MSLRPNSKSDLRRNRYKVAVDTDDGRRRREDDMIQIRKSKREESLQKRRREGLQSQLPTVENKLDNLATLVAGVCSDDANWQLEATTVFRNILSQEGNPPIEEVIQSGVVPRLVEFLTRVDFPKLQLEAAWALTNITSGTSENTKVVIDHGAVPIFVALLSSPSHDVREQAMWALGNIAGDSPQCRDLVIGHGALVSLLAQFNEHTQVSMLRIATWTLSNFCRGKPQPTFELVKLVLPALQRLILSNDKEVLIDACSALSCLSDEILNIDEIIRVGVCGQLVELLQHPSASVLLHVVRTVGNIVAGDDDMHTQVMINHGALPFLLSLLTQNHKQIIKQEACWTISNITAGNNKQVQAVIEAGLIAPLIGLLQNAEFKIKREAAWAITNAAAGGIHEQVKYLVDQGCIKPLCDQLNCPDPRVVIVCLRGLKNILKVGEAEKRLGNSGDSNLYAQMIEDSGGLEKIEYLQNHDNTEIYKRAVKLLEEFWLEEEDEILPSGNGGFNFN